MIIDDRLLLESLGPCIAKAERERKRERETERAGLERERLTQRERGIEAT